jgi:hypothetical protein
VDRTSGAHRLRAGGPGLVDLLSPSQGEPRFRDLQPDGALGLAACVLGVDLRCHESLPVRVAPIPHNEISRLGDIPFRSRFMREPSAASRVSKSQGGSSFVLVHSVTETIRRQADAYRRRAEEVRTTAENMSDEACKATMHRVAGGYERLAENLERVARRPDFLDGPTAAYARYKPRLVIIADRQRA